MAIPVKGLKRKDTKMQNILLMPTFLIKVAYLCDIFEKLNSLNVSLQGKNMHLLKPMGKISAFIKNSNYGEENVMKMQPKIVFQYCRNF
jgi:hypothetical protein